MADKKSKTKHPFNKTIIRDGRIVRIRKDGSIKADLGPYKQSPAKNDIK